MFFEFLCQRPCEEPCRNPDRCNIREIAGAAPSNTRRLTADGGRVSVGQRLRAIDRARDASAEPGRFGLGSLEDKGLYREGRR